jgi:hypothetical protein
VGVRGSTVPGLLGRRELVPLPSNIMNLLSVSAGLEIAQVDSSEADMQFIGVDLGWYGKPTGTARLKLAAEHSTS